jgi:flagellar biogenesis protein FliO
MITTTLNSFLIGMPSGLEWLFVVLALAILALPFVFIIWLVKYLARKKQQKQIY